jgi:ferrous iron transport protein A
MPLELLHAGQWGDVADIAGEESCVNRLAELGMRIGSRLQVLQPGSPCLLQIGESRLSLRGEWNMQILVRLQ